MLLQIVWILIIAIIMVCLQWMTVFKKKNGNKGSVGERASFIVLLLMGVSLNIALFKDWLTGSPLFVLRLLFGPAAQALAQWGMVGK